MGLEEEVLRLITMSRCITLGEIKMILKINDTALLKKILRKLVQEGAIVRRGLTVYCAE